MWILSNRVRRVLAAGMLALAAAAQGAAGYAADRAEVRDIVSDLMAGLDAAPMSAVPSNGAFDKVTVKLAEHPSGADGDPSIARAVRSVTVQVAGVMQQRAGDRYRFVSTQAHNALLADLQNGDAGDRDRVAAELAARGKPDILIQPVVFGDAGSRSLFYQAIGTHAGDILATTRAVRIQSRPVPEDKPILAAAVLTSGGSDGVFRPVALEAERLLLARGYDPGTIDGYIDDGLRRALRAYQRDSALMPNGRLTWETVENLRRDRRQSP